MSPIATCPKCDGLVNLPIGALANANVRCPLCAAEYPLEEAIEHLLPQLEIVDDQLSLFVPESGEAQTGQAEFDSADELLEGVSPSEPGQSAGAQLEVAGFELEDEVVEESEVETEDRELADELQGDELPEDRQRATEFEPLEFDDALTPGLDVRSERSDDTPVEIDTSEPEPAIGMPPAIDETEYASLTPPEPLAELGQEPFDDELLDFAAEQEDVAEIDFDSVNEEQLPKEFDEDGEVVPLVADEDEETLQFEPAERSELDDAGLPVDSDEDAESLDFEPLEPVAEGKERDLAFDPVVSPFVQPPQDDLDEIQLADDEPVHIGSGDAAQGAAGKAGEGIPLPRRREPRQPSFVGNLVGLVTSGVVGLTIAYLLILRFSGPQNDVLGLGPSLPTWLVGDKFQAHTGPLVQSQPFSAPAGTAPPTHPTPPGDASVGSLPRTAAEPPQGNAQPAGQPKPETTPPAAASQPDPFAALDDAATTTAPATAPKETAPAPDQDDPFAAPDEPLPTSDPTEISPVEPALGDGSPAQPPTTAEPAAVPAGEPAQAATLPDGPQENVVRRPTAEPGTPPGDATGSADQNPVYPKPNLRNPIRIIADYSADELTQAIAEVQGAAQATRAALDAKERRQRKLQFYRSLYRMASVLTFAEGATPQQRAEVSQLLLELADDSSKRDEIAKVGSQWLSIGSTRRGQHQGVVLAGSVESIEAEGKLFRIRLAMAGGVPSAVVLSSAQPKLNMHDEVVVVGTVFEEPKSQLADYEGAEPRVVWASLLQIAPGG